MTEMKLSQDELKKLTIKKAEKMIKSLQSAYSTRPDNMSLAEEKQMLEIMVATKKLADSVKKVFVELDAQKATQKD